MALQKQLAHLNLTGGLQRKDDQFIVIPSKLIEALDVEFDDESTVVRRGGQVKLDLTPIGAYSVLPPGQGYRTFSHKGTALIENAGTSFGLSKVWKSGGSAPVFNTNTPVDHSQALHFYRAGMTTRRIGSVANKGTAPGAGIPFYTGSHDCATIGDLTCHAWESRDPIAGRVTVRYQLLDEASNTTLYDLQVTDTTYAAPINVKPRVVASSTTNKFYIYYATLDSGTANFSIRCFTISTAGAITSAGTVTAGTTGGTAEGSVADVILFDVAFSTDLTKLGVVTLSGALVLSFHDVNTSNGYTTLATTTIAPSVRPRSLTALYSKNGSSQYILHAFYGINTNVAKACSRNFTAASSTAETTVGTAAGGTTVGRVAAFETSTSTIGIAYDSLTAVSTSYSSVLRLSTFTHSYGSLSECACCSTWFIAGRIALQRSRMYLPMLFVSRNNQTTTYLIDLQSYVTNLGVSGATGAPPHVVARIDYGEGALNYDRWQITNRVPGSSVRSNSIVIPYLKYETDTRLAGTVDDTPWSVSQATVDFGSQLGHQEINGLTFLAGACPHIYDGANYVEENFHHGPEIVSVTVVAGAGGTYALPTAVAATYTVCFTYGWEDSQGNWHESAPSNEVSVTTTGANYSITPSLLLPPTQKANVQLIMYRTKGSSTDTSLYLATTSYGSSITSDTDLGSSEQLYTAGNVLPNTPAPSCRHVSLFQKRLVLSGCGDGSKVFYSKTSDPGYGVEFNSFDPTHQTQAPVEKGRVVGTQELDDRLVVLCENGVGIISGTGPAITGTQGQYSDFATIITETGCSWDSPKSIIRGPEGVWFRSPFGIRLVSRSGSLARGQDGKQVGAEVDPLVTGNVVAIAGDAKQQVRFFAGSGRCFVWDYQWLQWSQFSGMSNVDAVYADDRYYHLTNVSTTPLLRYTNNSATTDVNDSGTANTDFDGVIETPWLSFAGIQGFQRVYRLMVLGRNVEGAGDTSVVFTGTSYYDFSATDVTPETFTGTVTLAGTFQWQHHFARQKCETIKIRIAFRPGASATGRFRLTDLTLQVGAKPGYYKLPSSKRI